MATKQREKEHSVMRRECIEESSKVARCMELDCMKARMVYSSGADSRMASKQTDNSSGVHRTNTLTRVAWCKTSSMVQVSFARKMESIKAAFKTASDRVLLPTFGKMATDTRACSRTTRRADMENYTTLKDNPSTKELGRMTR